MFRLRLLGGASLEGPDGPLTGAVAQRQRLALLSLIALSPTGTLSRDKLLAILWPETDPEKARHALSNALYMVRRELGEDALKATGEDLALNQDRVAVDALEFLAAVEAEEFDEAARLYLGPFMDGMYLKGTHEFEHWIDAERDRFKRAYGETLEKLAHEARARGDATQAAHWWRKLAALDPFNARTAVSLMSALDAAGNRAEAIQHAEIYASLLREEVGAEPDPEVILLAEELRRGPVRGGSQPSTELRTPSPEKPADLVKEAPPALGDSASASESKSPIRSPFLDLAEGPLFQWSLTYLAGAWFVLQAMDALSEPWGLSRELQRGLTGLLTLGFPVALGLAWFRSRKQGGTERRYRGLVLALILATLGLGLSMLAGPDPAPDLLDRSVVGGYQREMAVRRSLPSLAVLPFENISPNPEDAYLADGLHEELITQLSKISGLIVISRSSVLGYRDRRLPIPEVARQLNVGAILEGSVQKAGDVVRFTAQLIDGETDAHLWGESYDRTLTMENLFGVQTEISLRIAERLRATLTPTERSRLALRPTESLEAFELYLRGNQAYLRYQAQDNERALELFREALGQDPGFSLAWAGLSNAYSQGVLGFGLAPIWSDSALVAARRSIELDPNEAEGHKALGLAFTSMGLYRPALDGFMEALRLDPNHASASANVGVILLRFGSLDESLLWTRRNLEVNPNHSLARANLAWNYIALEEWALADARAREIVDRAPEIAHGHEALALLAAVRGAPRDGLGIAEEIVAMDPEAPARHQFAAEMALLARDWEGAERHSRAALSLTLGGGIPPFHLPATTLGLALLRTGESEEGMGYLTQAREAVAALMESGSDDPRLPWEMGCILAAEGRSAEAQEWLERGYEGGWRWARVAELDPILEPLRADVRFRTILSRMNQDVAAMRQRARESEEAAGLR